MIDFKRLIGARFFFNFAVRMQAVIVGWQMYTLTHEPLHLGLIGLAEAVPALGIAVYAGYLVDRSRPQLVFLNVLLGSLVSAAVVLAAQLVAHDRFEQIVALYAASVITGAARGFSQPAMFAVAPRLMPREGISRASAWMSSALQTAGVLGPAVGGVVFGWFNATSASALPCVSLLVAIGCWVTIRARIAPPTRTDQRRVRDELFSGAVFVWRHPILLPALSLDMLSVLFGGVTALLPIYASDILFVGARGLGALRAAPAIGSALVSLWLTRFEFRARAGRYLIAAVTGFGLCMLIFGLSQNFWVSLAVLALSGAFDGISVIVRSTAVQLVSPDHMRGRISAINSIFIGSSNELGEFESGMAAHWLGTVPAVTLGGLACLTTVALIAFRSPTLRRLHLGELEQG